MKKKFLLLLITLIPLIGYSQTTTLKNIQKESLNDTTVTALIFAEHAKLSTENVLLKEEINYYKELNTLCEEKDSIYKEEVDLYKNELHKQKSSQKKQILGSSVGGIVLFILGLIL